jgi:hypothetical protein
MHLRQTSPLAGKVDLSMEGIDDLGCLLGADKMINSNEQTANQTGYTCCYYRVQKIYINLAHGVFFLNICRVF